MRYNQKMIFIKLPLPISVNRMYIRTKRRVILSSEARTYKEESKIRLSKYKNSFDAHQEIIYFTLWGLSNKRGDTHNNEKLLWDSLEYAGVYPNDRALRHCAGSTYMMDEKKEGFVIVGLCAYDAYLANPISLNELTDIAKRKFVT